MLRLGVKWSGRGNDAITRCCRLNTLNSVDINVCMARLVILISLPLCLLLLIALSTLSNSNPAATVTHFIRDIAGQPTVVTKNVAQSDSVNNTMPLHNPLWCVLPARAAC